MRWTACDSVFNFPRPMVVMGVVNTTPDSFSDGGHFLDNDMATDHGLRLVDEGAEIIDIGGESTRPGSEHVSVKEELRRVVPVIERLAKRCDQPKTHCSPHFTGGICGARGKSIFDELTRKLSTPNPTNLTD